MPCLQCCCWGAAYTLPHGRKVRDVSPKTTWSKMAFAAFSSWLNRRLPITEMKYWHTSAFPLCCHCCFLALEPWPDYCRVVAVFCDYSVLQGWHPPGPLALWQEVRIQELNSCSDAQVDIYREGRFSCVSSKQAFIILLAQHELIRVTSGPWLSLPNLMLKKTQYLTL